MSGAARFVGSAGAILTDPPVAASLLLGAGAASGILRTALIEGGIGVGVEIPVQAAVQTSRQEVGEEANLAEAARNVALAGAGGLVLGGALKGAGIGSRKLVEKYRANPQIHTREGNDAAATVEALHELEATNPIPEQPGHIQRVEEATRQLLEGDTLVPGIPDDLIAPPPSTRRVQWGGSKRPASRELTGGLVENPRPELYRQDAAMTARQRVTTVLVDGDGAAGVPRRGPDLAAARAEVEQLRSVAEARKESRVLGDADVRQELQRRERSLSQREIIHSGAEQLISRAEAKARKARGFGDIIEDAGRRPGRAARRGDADPGPDGTGLAWDGVNRQRTQFVVNDGVPELRIPERILAEKDPELAANVRQLDRQIADAEAEVRAMDGVLNRYGREGDVGKRNVKANRLQKLRDRRKDLDGQVTGIAWRTRIAEQREEGKRFRKAVGTDDDEGKMLDGAYTQAAKIRAKAEKDMMDAGEVIDGPAPAPDDSVQGSLFDSLTAPDEATRKRIEKATEDQALDALAESDDVRVTVQDDDGAVRTLTGRELAEEIRREEAFLKDLDDCIAEALT